MGREGNRKGEEGRRRWKWEEGRGGGEGLGGSTFRLGVGLLYVGLFFGWWWMLYS